jgi:hypothetical protein
MLVRGADTADGIELFLCVGRVLSIAFYFVFGGMLEERLRFPELTLLRGLRGGEIAVYLLGMLLWV